MNKPGRNYLRSRTYLHFGHHSVKVGMSSSLIFYVYYIRISFLSRFWTLTGAVLFNLSDLILHA
jgi:hypothetical protein